MATIESYETSGGKRYMVRFRTPDRTQSKKRGFKTKRDAEAFAATVEVEKMRGEYVPPSLGRITVAELAPEWLKRKQADVAPSNYRTLDSAWRTHVQPRWGSVRIADVELARVEQWIAQMQRDEVDADGEIVKKGAGATVVIRAYGVLAAILDDAVKSRRLTSNPARGIENLPRKTTKRRVYLSAEDVALLAVEAGQHRSLVLTLAYTGLRWGEAVALRVRDVEFLRRRLTVHDNAVQLGVDHAVGRTKSKRTRSVPVPEFVLDELSVLCRGKAADDLVFPGPNGGYLPRPKSVGGWFAGAVKRAGVQRITPHDLRHTAASLAVSAGVNVLALARMLGHTSAKVTLDTYADLFDSDLDAVALTLHARYSQTSVPNACPKSEPEPVSRAQKSPSPA
ncbi:tyrosine-type recombinase/integrase [Rhodococcus rhodochrous]|uniref:Integrase n=1 Tax=Rhodococcus rhodochrous KG-21 TaxID=1441923 RepID=A0A0M8PM50_RHORH|nr:tyrosine-type recombinase/integrase [Rhodococcus rhodochrous]KOS54508.1 integrase [Rhodococcus rhodochrous KG-21]